MCYMWFCAFGLEHVYVYVHLVRLGKCVCGCQAAHTFSRCSVIGYVALFGDSLKSLKLTLVWSGSCWRGGLHICWIEEKEEEEAGKQNNTGPVGLPKFE